jgi:hypothetical protein
VWGVVISVQLDIETSMATEVCVAYQFIRKLKAALCKKTTRQPSPTRPILEITPLMYGGASVLDLSALC